MKVNKQNVRAQEFHQTNSRTKSLWQLIRSKFENKNKNLDSYHGPKIAPLPLANIVGQHVSTRLGGGLGQGCPMCTPGGAVGGGDAPPPPCHLESISDNNNKDILFRKNR